MITALHHYSNKASILAVLLVAALPYTASAANCGIMNGKNIQDSPGIACPGGTCPVDQLDQIAQAVAGGCDPPLNLCAALGTSSRNDTGTTTPSGYCAPGVNGLAGSPTCPIYNVNGNPNAIANNGAGASIFGAGGTGNMNPLAALAGTNILNQALNQPATPTGNTLPVLPCGGAVGLLNQALTIGDLRIGVPPAPSTATAVQVIANTLGTGNCAGGTLTIPAAEASLLLPQTTGTTPIANGQVASPAGSIISLPGGTPVLFGVNTAGTVLLPSGATLTGPDGSIVTIPQNSTLTSLGGGSLQLPPGSVYDGITYPNGLTIVYPAGSGLLTNGSVNINTTAIGLPAGTQVPVDPNGQVVTPQAG